MSANTDFGLAITPVHGLVQEEHRDERTADDNQGKGNDQQN
jgi:hypothetical protein